MKSKYINFDLIRELFIPSIIFLVFWMIGIVFSRDFILLFQSKAPDSVNFSQMYPAEIAVLMLKIALFFSLYFSLPSISYYFLKEKMRKFGFNNKKELIFFLLTGFFIAIAAFLFANYLIIPLMLYFFIGLTGKIALLNLNISSYLSFCLQLLFLITFIAEIPVLIYFIIKSDFKQKYPSFHSQIMPFSVGISIILLSNEILPIIFLSLIIFCLVMLISHLSDLF